MSGQKYLRTNFDDDDDHLVDTGLPGAAVSGVSPVEPPGSAGLDGGGRRGPSGHGVSVYSTTVAFGGIDSAPAVRAVCRYDHPVWVGGCVHAWTLQRARRFRTGRRESHRLI